MEEKKIVEEETVKEEIGTETYVHEFRKPYCYEGKEYTELTFRFGDLTGLDTMRIHEEATALGMQPITVRQFDANFQLCTAVRACVEKLPREAYLAMPMGEFNRIVDHARSFLLGMGY